MEVLKQRILKDGNVLGETILKVDSFLNHGVDPHLMYEIGTEFKNYFKNHGITKIFTIESSGIAPTVMTAMQMNVPMVTLKKQASKILNRDVYQTTVHSFTKAMNYELTISKKYISENDNILIIDDFLANGEAALGVIRLIEEAGAKVAGIGIVIEKSFQPGRQLLVDRGHDVYSLARISKLGEGIIEFIEE
ncbi:MAG: xanthine phosphoribosyltransferase [Turicibacter sp.]|nr:xanthine phosphoribosyltransferase [Turicibacter sp.]